MLLMKISAEGIKRQRKMFVGEGGVRIRFSINPVRDYPHLFLGTPKLKVLQPVNI